MKIVSKDDIYQPELSVFYDGLCPLCSKEIDLYRGKANSEKIRFVDISQPDFNAHSEGLDPEKVHERFHVKLEDGTIIEGVDAFVEIWKCLGIWRPMQILATYSFTRPAFDLGYNVFAKIRPIFRRQECEDNVCHTRGRF